MRLTIALLLSITAAQAGSLGKWLAVGACAASGFDGAVTLARANPSIREANPLLRAPGGQPSAWKISLWKAGSCGATLYLAYKYPERRAVEVISVGQMAGFTWAGVHNLRLTGGK